MISARRYSSGSVCSLWPPHCRRVSPIFSARSSLSVHSIRPPTRPSIHPPTHPPTPLTLYCAFRSFLSYASHYTHTHTNTHHHYHFTPFSPLLLIVFRTHSSLLTPHSLLTRVSRLFVTTVRNRPTQPSPSPTPNSRLTRSVCCWRRAT